jgi:hypothetical protein
MKKACIIIVCTMAFVSAAAFAQTPSVAPLTGEALAVILGEPAVTASCPSPGPSPQSEVLFAARRPAVPKACSATANCTPGTTVSCTYTGTGGTCTAVDRNCSVNQRGYVSCNGVVTNCPTTCQSCNLICQACNQCDQTGDCFACCRCDGGTISQCSQQCS